MDDIPLQVIELALICSLIGLVFLGTFVLLAIKMLKSGSRKSRVDSEDEARMIQEMFQGLRKMERRIEALETILLDPDRERGSHES